MNGWYCCTLRRKFTKVKKECPLTHASYRIIPPHIYISLCVLAWGLVASLQSVVGSLFSLLMLRALLGICEAGFGPGVPFYLSFFFRRDELAFRTGLFVSAAPLASSFASSLAWLITKLSTDGPIAPWRLLFLLEGFPSVVIAIFAWLWIPDSPESANFLNYREKQIACTRLQSENGDDQRDASHRQKTRRRLTREKTNLSISKVLSILLEPKCFLTAVCSHDSSHVYVDLLLMLTHLVYVFMLQCRL